MGIGVYKLQPGKDNHATCSYVYAQNEMAAFQQIPHWGPVQTLSGHDCAPRMST